MAASGKDWDAAQYLKFERERTRPSLDLLSQVPLANPKRVLDLGCGPGNSTAVLLRRFPNAQITGIDSSPDMIGKAKKTLPGIEFRLEDLTSVKDTEDADLLFSNAVYQWLPYEKRLQIFSDLIKSQKTGGVFAFQVPDNMLEPSHVAMRSVAEEGPWSEMFKRHPPARKPFQSPQEIYDRLKPLCSDVNIWHTSYYHILDGHEAIVEWVKATGLRPFLDPLSASEREEFLAAYLKRIQEVYPPLHDGKVCLRFPRLFVVAVRA
ncbi:trans-aconitate 2-methyltransferase [Capronia coronata CBS 617.96]|uniref:Trans-aconitate 2-methyltransferase n=1 Tax=Capronia coronata CBS 617.96 TaxID=1182541 RepID=W9YLZ6_9EURO|nr:trans-aconitate 2-methyltransferase [Capronia coronata CBS 617.96]EXJ90705.1 trans-aconitate 2-methyltransferase [Capronia coronata CBS 617.96]